LALLALPLVLLALAACTRIGNPEGGSGGVVSGDTLYVATRDGELIALDRVSGEKLWGFVLESEERDLALYGDPVVSDDTVYVGGYDGTLYALSTAARRGLEPEEKDSERVPGHIIGSLVVADDVLLAGSSDGRLYAFDIVREPHLDLEMRDGFFFETAGMVWSTPTVDDGVVYFGSFDRGVYAVGLEDGVRRWRFPTDGGVPASPVVEDGRLYVGSIDSTFYAIDVETGRAVWRFDGGGSWYWSRAVISGGVVFAPSLDGNLYALNKSSGSLLWTLETDGALVGAPVLVRDMLAVPSLDGVLRLVNVDDGSVEFICDVEEEIWSSLNQSDGVIYFRAHDRSVRSLDVSGRGSPDEGWQFDVREDPGKQVVSWACTGPKKP
jgi:outer membrane protein assembly factor BamB